MTELCGKALVKSICTGGNHASILLENGELYVIGNVFCCGTYVPLSSEQRGMFVPTLVATSIDYICCAYASTIGKSANNKWIAFGYQDESKCNMIDFGYNQTAPAYGKQVSMIPSRIDDIFPKPACTVKKLVASWYCFFLLYEDGDLYCIGNGENFEMGMNDGANIDTWTLCKQNVHDVHCGSVNSFVLVYK